MSFNQNKIQSGFTLIELIVVIIIIGILAAVALPKFISLGNEARTASVNALAAALKSASNTWALVCRTQEATFDCDTGDFPNILVYQGRNVGFANGYPEAGDALGTNQIDTLIDYSGFTASRPDQYNTKFSINSAPDSTNCFVNYKQAMKLPSLTAPAITTATSGC